jgi:hypothetical protein
MPVKPAKKKSWLRKHALLLTAIGLAAYYRYKLQQLNGVECLRLTPESLKTLEHGSYVVFPIRNEDYILQKIFLGEEYD